MADVRNWKIDYRMCDIGLPVPAEASLLIYNVGHTTNISDVILLLVIITDSYAIPSFESLVQRC